MISHVLGQHENLGRYQRSMIPGADNREGYDMVAYARKPVTKI